MSKNEITEITEIVNNKKTIEIKNNVFAVLSVVDVSDKIEKKNNLSYLSWAWAWSTTKKIYPNTYYTIYENKDGLNYHHDGKTAWVKTGVTIENIEYIEYLPVMDYRNKSISLEQLTSFDVNKAIQRSLTKALARHGLGLYIYAGEDLPDGEKQQSQELNEEQILDIEKMILETNTDRQRFLQFFKVAQTKDLNYDSSIKALQKKANKEK